MLSSMLCVYKEINIYTPNTYYVLLLYSSLCWLYRIFYCTTWYVTRLINGMVYGTLHCRYICGMVWYQDHKLICVRQWFRFIFLFYLGMKRMPLVWCTIPTVCIFCVGISISNGISGSDDAGWDSSLDSGISNLDLEISIGNQL